MRYKSKYDMLPTMRLNTHTGWSGRKMRLLNAHGANIVIAAMSHRNGLIIGIKMAPPKVSWNRKNFFQPRS